MKNTLKIMGALSDVTRLRIFLLLAGGSLCVCEIVYILDMKQSRISRIMKKFKDAGLVRRERDGRKIIYSLSPEALGLGLVRGIMDDAKIDEADLKKLKQCKQERIREGGK